VVVDSLTSNSGCALQIDATSGPVNVYFTGASTWVSNMNVTSTSPSAKRVALLHRLGPRRPGGERDPDRDDLRAERGGEHQQQLGRLRAIMAKSMAFASNFQIHYDESLGLERPERIARPIDLLVVPDAAPDEPDGQEAERPVRPPRDREGELLYPANAWN
jgi:hypothetical protein